MQRLQGLVWTALVAIVLTSCSSKTEVAATLVEEAAEEVSEQRSTESCPNLFVLGKATTSAKQVEVAGISCDDAVPVIKGVEALGPDSITPYAVDGFECTAQYGSRTAVQFWNCAEGERSIAFTTQ